MRALSLGNGLSDRFQAPRLWRNLFAGLLLVGVGACAEGPAGPALPPSGNCIPTRVAELGPVEVIDLAAPWEAVTPAEVGVDECRIEPAVAKAARDDRSRALVGVRGGRIFLEEYFWGSSRQTLHDVRSVTKSVISTLTGLALERGHISSLDDPIGLYLPYIVAPLDSLEASITFRNLLTMTSGFEWNEAEYNGWVGSGDPVRALLDRPIVASPGSRFRYNSAAVHLLSVVLQAAIGEPIWSFAERELFAPIGIEAVVWELFNPTYANGASGIDLRARDLARFGQLFIQGGMSGSRRILPEGWVESATTPAFSDRWSYGPLRDYTYGLLWWISEGEPETAYFAWGYGGQHVYVVPDLELVLVATTEYRGLSGTGRLRPQQEAVLGVLLDLHRAVRGD